MLPRHLSPQERRALRARQLQGQPAPAAGPRHAPSTTVQDLRAQLPAKVPSRRSLAVYHEVVIRRRTHEEVAKQFQISRQRVGQLVRQVQRYKSNLPAQIQGLTEEQQINLATHETRQWLEEVRDQAIRKLQETRHTEERTLDDGSGTSQKASVTRQLPPRSGFLAVALQAVSRWGALGGAGEQWNIKRIVSHRRARFGKLGTPPLGASGKKNFGQFCIQGKKYRHGKSCADRDQQ